MSGGFEQAKSRVCQSEGAYVTMRPLASSWEQRKFSDLVLIERGGSPRPIDAYITEDPAGLNWVKIGDAPSMGRYITSTSEKIKPEGLSKTRQVYPGDLVLSNSMSFGRPYIMAVEGCIHDGWLLIRDTQYQFDPVFLCHMLGTPQMLDQYRMFASGSTVNNLNKELVGNAMVPLPNRDEQVKIGKYLDELDSLITLHQRKYDKLCAVKKSMLDKMFPKPGETKPEIRFDGFTDPWEQRKLGSIAASFDYGLNAAATEYDGQNKYLRITDIDDTTHEFLKSDLTTPLADLAMSADYLLEEGDLLFARTGASVGKTYLYRQYDGTVYFAGFLIRARIGESADPEFVYQATLTDAYKKYVAITSQRSGQPGVNAQEYADYQLMLPSRTEQQQIGMTLRSLDNFITLHQRKLNLLRNTKKSLLDKMFV